MNAHGTIIWFGCLDISQLASFLCIPRCSSLSRYQRLRQLRLVPFTPPFDGATRTVLCAPVRGTRVQYWRPHIGHAATGVPLRPVACGLLMRGAY